MICSTTTYNWVSNFQVGANVPLPPKRNPTHGYKVAHEVGYSMVNEITFTMPACYHLAVKNRAVNSCNTEFILRIFPISWVANLELQYSWKYLQNRGMLYVI